uniref:Kinesin light chain n=1 Tax=Cryptomonas curvata TaxID=233186 RepID=A0A7S0M762_9CRYP
MEAVGEVHMDTALLYNNMGVCYDMLDRVTEAAESYERAGDVFRFEFGLTHPRTAVVMRNLSKVRQRRLDFRVTFAPRAATACPAAIAGGAGKKKKKKGKKGKGGKGAKGKKKK